jgi:PAS domain S-box-containing protein/excisionase family DNA binding protein
MDSARGPLPPDQRLPADDVAGRAYYSISQAAALLGVSRVSVWRWIQAGRLPVWRLGHRTTRIKRVDLERFLGQSGAASARARGAVEPGAGGTPPAADAAEHIVHFYESDAALLDAARDFIGPALRTDGVGIVIATQAHREGLEQRLQADGLDMALARARGQYLALDAAETLARIMVDGAPDRARFATVAGDLIGRAAGRRARVFGELVALLVDDSNHAAAIRLEELWNELQRTHGFALMCGYPMGGFDGAAFTEQLGAVCAQHDRIVPAESFSALATSDERLRAVAVLQQQARSLQAEVAERRRAEAQLTAALAAERRKERELSEFVETAPLGLNWIGPDGTIRWANRTEAELLGYGLEEYLGQHIAAFHADRDVVDDLLARLGRGESLREYPARLRSKDGSIRHVLIDSSPLWEEGQLVHNRCFTRDVTELRRADEERVRLLERERAARWEAQRVAERIRRLQEITTQLSQSLEVDRVLASVAHSAADLLQAPVGAVFLLDRCDPERDFALAAAHGIDAARASGLRLPRHASLAGRAVDEGRTLVVDDVRATPGTALPALLTGQTDGSEIAAPITAGSDRLGVVKVFSPVARRFGPDDAALLTTLAAAAAVALTNARLYQEAQDALATRDEFLAAAAHDLKTPLTGIKALAQLLQRRLMRAGAAEAERLAEGLASIDASVTQLGAQIDELLGLVRLEMGQPLELDRRPTDLVQLARRVIAEQQRTTERHRLRLETAVTDLVGDWDAVRLMRVLANLVTNAIKYSPAGGELTVSIAREGDDAGGWAVLAVRDQGLGIPAADLPRIFDRFRRAGNVVGRIGGTGIGLTSARQIVEQHGGTIAVTSQEGVGSTFTVRLPLGRGQEE